MAAPAVVERGGSALPLGSVSLSWGAIRCGHLTYVVAAPTQPPDEDCRFIPLRVSFRGLALYQDDPLAVTIGWIAQLRVRTASLLGGAWLTGALIFLVALAVRLDLSVLSPFDRFTTFHIALVLITLIGGWRRASCFAILSALCGWYFLLRAPDAPGLPPPSRAATLLSLGSFAALAAVEIALAEALAGTAALLSSHTSAVLDPRLTALHRRARTAVQFVTQPLASLAASDAASAAPQSPPDPIWAALAVEIGNRRDLFLRLDRAVLDWAALDAQADGRADGHEWAELMEAFCRAQVAAAGAVKPLCRVAGRTDALNPDRLLAISLAVAELAREAIDSRRAIFEVALVTDGGGRCTLDVRTPGTLPATLGDDGAPDPLGRPIGVLARAQPGVTPFSLVTQWLAQLLSASLTICGPEQEGIRFDFDL